MRTDSCDSDDKPEKESLGRAPILFPRKSLHHWHAGSPVARTNNARTQRGAVQQHTVLRETPGSRRPLGSTRARWSSGPCRVNQHRRITTTPRLTVLSGTAAVQAHRARSLRPGSSPSFCAEQRAVTQRALKARTRSHRIPSDGKPANAPLDSAVMRFPDRSLQCGSAASSAAAVPPSPTHRVATLDSCANVPFEIDVIRLPPRSLRAREPVSRHRERLCTDPTGRRGSIARRT